MSEFTAPEPELPEQAEHGLNLLGQFDLISAPKEDDDEMRAEDMGQYDQSHHLQQEDEMMDDDDTEALQQ